MAVVSFTLSEEGVTALRDALLCLNKFSDDVSLEAKKDKLLLTALNLSKSAYACFTFSTARFFSRYHFEGNAANRERFFCTLYIRALISIFRTRSGGGGGDLQRDRERESAVDKCEVSIEDGPNVKSRFITKIVFRNGMTSIHRLPFEVAPPIHGRFDKSEAVHHWTIHPRTLRQLMDHFGPGIDLLDLNSDGENLNFTGTSEKTVNGDDALKKPLQTSIAVDVDEFDDIEVEDKLHIIVSVKDFRAIIHHAAITGSDLSARYSHPARPIQLCYHGDGINCEFLLMTVGERGNPAQKTRKARKQDARQPLEAEARRASAAPSLPPQPAKPAPAAELAAQLAAAVPRPSASRLSNFDLRPTQRPPAPTMQSEGLFVENEDDWEPVRDEDDEDEENARLGWDHSNQGNPATMHMSAMAAEQNGQTEWTPASSGIPGLEPTQPLSEVQKFGLFFRQS